MLQWKIDAFAAGPFSGNAACVVEPMREWPSTLWMQKLARENAAGATAYMVSSATRDRFALRWFTGAVEVPLCGHATLAAAHALFREIGIASDVVTFDTASGSLVVRQRDGRLEMDFPAQEPTRIAPPAGIAEALGAEPVEVWSGPYLVALLSTPEAVHAIEPDLGLLRPVSLRHHGQGNVGVAAVMHDRSRYDVVDRFFAPGYGLEEDPATGSFHCILTPLLAGKLEVKEIRFHQACPGRGADIHGVAAGDRVLLSGGAVTMIQSDLRVMPDIF